jgi:hypothetical protein
VARAVFGSTRGAIACDEDAVLPYILIPHIDGQASQKAG